MTIPDISTFSATDLLALRAAIDERLQTIKQRHIEEGAALGLSLVNGDERKQRKRRNAHKEAD